MNEKGVFQIRHRQFKFRSKCMFFWSSSARGLLREFKRFRFQTSFSGHKCIKNVWRPGSARTRWGSLSAPPDPLAANVAASWPGGGKLFPSHCFPPLVSTTNRTLHGGDPQAGSILTCLQARSCLGKFKTCQEIWPSMPDESPFLLLKVR